ncbi:hypothetical protein [Actinomadura sp. NBRC 104412]|uniref:hypothetical protein n=1 Tax=Actinomadura sp. NBRC 104412 TaxID=3032203 RepID=UPI0025527C7E|nr:hypothetical protein [Actinomadura sp. NBRC 104412]
MIVSVWAVLAGLAGSETMLTLLFFGGAATMVAVSSVGCHARQGVPTWDMPEYSGAAVARRPDVGCWHVGGARGDR